MWVEYCIRSREVAADFTETEQEFIRVLDALQPQSAKFLNSQEVLRFRETFQLPRANLGLHLASCAALSGRDRAGCQDSAGQNRISVCFNEKVAFQKRMRQVAQFVIKHGDQM